MTQGKRTPIESSMIARAVAGVRYALTGVSPEGWYSPGQPLLPQAQDEAKGRAFDFPTGVNTRMTPRGDEAISFGQLRTLADSYDLLRLVIETRKDQMSRLKFTVQNIDEDIEPDERCKQVQEFLRFPDQEHDWDTWIRMVIEDLLVLDAVAIYPRMNLGGTLYALEPVDGSTIKRVINIDGRTPMAPEPAYQQIIKGLPAVDYSRDELVYKPRNKRTNKVYGYSPVEQIVMTVNIAMRRQLYQLQYYTEGSVPDLIMQVPAEWNPDQIKQFSQWWQGLLAGNTANRSRAMFVPSGVMPVDTKEKALHDQFDDWLARVVCYAFGISPGGFVKDQNKATAGVAKDIASEEGLQPVMQWTKSLIDYIIVKHFGFTDLCFTWSAEQDHDPLQQAQINQIYLAAKVVTPDEVRADLGKDPLTPDQIELLTPPPPPALAGAPGAFGKPGAPTPPNTPNGAQEANNVPTAAEKVEHHHHINVSAPVINMPEIKLPDYHAPDIKVEGATINVTTPDVLVDIGSTTIQAQFDAPIPADVRKITKTITATRGTDGTLIGKVIEE